jgi:hypothetical protein
MPKGLRSDDSPVLIGYMPEPTIISAMSCRAERELSLIGETTVVTTDW